MVQEEIRHFRMINSEEVIGTIIAETDASYIVKNPYIVVELPTSIALQKYVPFSANQSIELKKIHIISTTELHSEMIRYYHNTMTIGKDSAAKAMVGLSQVNDMMEEYIYEGTLPESMTTMDMSNFDMVPVSNTYH